MSNTQVKGLKELTQFLQKLPDNLQNGVMRGAMRAGAKVLQTEAEQNVPVDQGDLKNSFKVSTRSRRGVVVATVRADDYKARWVEYGTAAHWISVDATAKPTRMTRRGRRSVSLKTLNKALAQGSLKIGVHFVGASVAHPGARPHPFMRPALDAKAGDAVVAAGNYIKARLSSKHGLDTSGVSVEKDE